MRTARVRGRRSILLACVHAGFVASSGCGGGAGNPDGGALVAMDGGADASPAPLDGGADAWSPPGDGGDLGPDFRSGTRLRVRSLRSGDLPPFFLTFVDSARGLDCEFQPASDGRWRCLPPSDLNEQRAFADDGCVVPALTMQRELGCIADRPLFTLGVSDGDCQPLTYHVYEATPLPLGTTAYRRDEQGACVPITDLEGHKRMVRLGAEVPPSDFVAATRVKVARPNARVGVTRWVAEDGAYQSTGLYETSTDWICSVFRTSEGLRCIPSGRLSFVAGLIYDTECARPLASSSCGTDSNYVIDRGSGDNDAIARVFEVGAPFSGTPFTRYTSGACVPSVFADPLWNVGSEILDHDRFPRVTPIELGRGRLRVSAVGDETGALLLGTASAWWSLDGVEGALEDATLDKGCSPAFVGADVYCLPAGLPEIPDLSGFYANQSCSGTEFLDCRDGCDEGIAAVNAEVGTAPGLNGYFACSDVIDHLVSIGDAYAGSEFYYDYRGSCSGPSAVGDFLALRARGPRISHETFARFDVVTE